MKVKQLIKELKKMPQNLEVEVGMHDNAEYESAGDVCAVDHFIKEDYDMDDLSAESQMMFDSMVDECVIIRC
jgi:hypothetical protein